jgi:Fe-S oxidoreductase
MRLGYHVEIPRHIESGRAAMSKGCLKCAKKIACDNVAMLSNQVGEHQPLVGIEPSAILSFRDEYPDLVPSDMRKEAMALGRYSLLYDEFLWNKIQEGQIGPECFESVSMEIWLHGHCHQKALIGVDKTVSVLEKLLPGAKINVIPSGCCGMAGSFGYEAEHYKTSLQIGEMVLFPTIRKVVDKQAETPTIVAAPGFSCRQQILDGTGVKAVHPIEILYRFLKNK